MSVHDPIKTGLFCSMVARQLGARLFAEGSRCPSFRCKMDARGDHAIAFCSFHPMTSIHRHDQIKRALSNDVLEAASLPVQDDAPGLMRTTQGRCNEDLPAHNAHRTTRALPQDHRQLYDYQS